MYAWYDKVLDYPRGKPWIGFVKKPSFFITASLLAGLLSFNTASFAANLSIFPQTHDFGAVGVNSSATKRFIVGNEHRFAIDLAQAVVYGNVSTTADAFGNVTTVYEPSPDFELGADNCSNRNLLGFGDDSCSSTVAFKPQSTGSKTAHLGIPTSDPNTPFLEVNLTGTGASLPNLVIQPLEIAFGNHTVGTTATQNIVLSNTGLGDLTTSTITAAPPFSVSSNCSSTIIAAQTSCTLEVKFTPTHSQVLISRLQINSNDPNTPIAKVRMTGQGIGTPQFSITPADGTFGFANVGTFTTRNYTISNLGSDILHIGKMSVQGSSAFILNSSCANRGIPAAGNCQFTVRFQPTSEADATATLSISSNDPDTPNHNVALSGTGTCTQAEAISFSSFPNPLNLGGVAVGEKTYLYFNVRYRGIGCAQTKLSDVILQGANAAEFTLKSKTCRHGQTQSWTVPGRTYFYSNCHMQVVFEPTSLGDKDVSIQASTDNAAISPLVTDIKAIAEVANPSVEMTPSSYDFGQIKALVENSHTNIRLTNTGNVNLSFTTQLQTSNPEAFRAYLPWSCRKALKPGTSCDFAITFSPVSSGTQTANFILRSNADTQELALTGESIALADCEANNITIRSNTTVGRWDDAASWQRVQAVSSSATPTADDVVLIQANHIIAGQAVNSVKALCVARGGRLHSPVTGEALEVIASEYIENKGTIYGLNGLNEAFGASCTRDMLGSTDCASAGAGVILKVGQRIESRGKIGDIWWSSRSSGGPILNEGNILGGHGGSGSSYAGDGGVALVLGRNTNNRGLIQAGNGGDVTGTGGGQAGRGGLTQIWGKLGGRGYLKNLNGARALAGNGGNCNPAAAQQVAGRGGNLWLVSLPDVFLNNGIHAGGRAGNNCQIRADNGWVRIEPGLISLAGNSTSVTGSNVFIYGGNDWTLDLSGLSPNAIQADNKLVLAVGEGGVVNMEGMSDGALQAGEEVQILSNDIITGEDKTVADGIQAPNLVLEPSQVLQDVSLSGTCIVQRPSTATTTSISDETTWAVNLTLSNNGAGDDTYTISYTDTAGWTLNNLPDSIEVPALTSVDLALLLPLSANVGETNYITVTATSQSNTDVSSSMQIEVTVTDIEVVTVDANTQPSGALPPVSSGSTGSAGGVSGCFNSGTLDSICAGGQQVLVDVSIGVNGVISYVTLGGTIDNQGMVSQATIQADATLTGGKLTGYINNAGTLVDIEFVGASLVGGTLAGNTVNNSQVDGIISDVSFAGQASLSGGTLAGIVQGDVNAPAELSDLEIEAGTTLSGVVINPSVTLPTDVNLGAGVRFKYPLPFNNSLGITPDGVFSTPASQFAAGVASGNFAFTTQTEVSTNDKVYFTSEIGVPSGHVGQTADILLVFGHEPAAPYQGDLDTSYFSIAADGTPTAVDLYTAAETWMAQLTPFMSAVTLEETLLVNVWQGQLQDKGMYYLFIGYRLADGQIVYSDTPVFVEVE